MGGPVDELGSAHRENREVNAERWREILESARLEFMEVGYAAARLQDIARRAGITAASLYHYIESKEDLLYELIRSSHERSLAAAIALQDDPTESAAERLRTLIVGWGAFARELPFVVQDRDNRFLTPAHRRVIDDLRREVVTTGRVIVDRGMRDGTFDASLDPAVVVFSLFGLLNAPRQWYGPEIKVPFGPTYDWFAEAVIGALTEPGARVMADLAGS